MSENIKDRIEDISHNPEAIRLRRGDVLGTPVGARTLLFRIELLERDIQSNTWFRAFQVPKGDLFIPANPLTGFLSEDCSELCAIYSDDAHHLLIAAIEPWKPGNLRFPNLGATCNGIGYCSGPCHTWNVPMPERLTYEKFVSILSDGENRLGVMYYHNGMAFATPELLKQAKAEGWADAHLQKEKTL